MFRNVIMPFTPLLLYGYVLLRCFKHLRKTVPDDRLHPMLDQAMSFCLNLLGFSITILCVLLTLSTIEIGSLLETVLFHISFSIGYFLLSYTLLRLRLKSVFVFVAMALKNAGLWTLISGAMFFLYKLSDAYLVLVVVLIIFSIYLIVDSYLFQKTLK